MPLEDLGHLHVALEELTPLQEKALEHGATVLALELVKERAQQQVEWQLQGDLLSNCSTPPRRRWSPAPAATASTSHARTGSSSCAARDLLDRVRHATGRTLSTATRPWSARAARTSCSPPATPSR